MRLYLQSPGGNVVEAFKIGRMIRQRLLQTNAHSHLKLGQHVSEIKCGTYGKPVCCASACALAYLGGAQWSAGDHLGLHRPLLEDLGDYDYAEAQQHMRRVAILIREYLEEMEADERIHTLMMNTPPNAISVWAVDPNPQKAVADIYRYPNSIRDWLFARCRRMGDRPREGCLGDELIKEMRERAKQSPPDEKERAFHKMTIPELRTVLGSQKRGSLDFIYASERLAQLRLEQDRRSIDEMGLCEIKEYIDARFGDDKKLMEAERMTFPRASERLEALTGDPNPWSERNRMPKGCPGYRSRF